MDFVFIVAHLNIEEAAEIFEGFAIFNDNNNNNNNNRFIYSWQK